MLHYLLPEGEKERNDRQTQRRKVTREDVGKREAEGGLYLRRRKKRNVGEREISLTLFCDVGMLGESR